MCEFLFGIAKGRRVCHQQRSLLSPKALTVSGTTDLLAKVTGLLATVTGLLAKVTSQWGHSRQEQRSFVLLQEL